MDGNFSLKRKKIATFTTTAAVAATTDEGVFEPCLREKQVYGTTAEVMEFEQESYVSKDEVWPLILPWFVFESNVYESVLVCN